MSDKFLGDSTVKAGTTSVSLWFYIETQAGAPVTGLVAASVTCSYWRQGGLRVAITDSDLAAVDSAYSSGGLKEVDATNMKGVYRFDVPDAALATGADWVVVSILPTITGSYKTAQRSLTLPTYDVVRDAIFAKIIETQGSYTAQQALSILLAVMAGQSSSSGATLKSPNGVSTRVAATLDGSNNRTAMTLTPSA